MMNSVSMRNKILSISALLLTLLLVNAWYVNQAMSSIGHELEQIVERDIPMTIKTTKVLEHFLHQTIVLERYQRHMALARQDSAELDIAINLKQAFYQQENQLRDDLKDASDFAQTAINELSDKKLVEEFRLLHKKLSKIEQEYESFLDISHNLIQAIEANKYVSKDLVKTLEHQEDAIEKHISEVLHEIEGFTQHAVGVAREHEESALENSLIGVALSIVIGILVSWKFASIIAQRLERIVASSANIASGDLTRAIEKDGSDEIGRLQGAMLNMQHHLAAMIENIGNNSSQLASAMEELSVTTQQTGSNIDAQQAKTAQVATAMEQMSASVEEVASNSVNTSNSLTAANSHAQAARNDMSDTLVGMQQLSQGMNEAGDMIRKVGSDTENINAVLEVIKSVAEQTNLLALNAAIEAARAGEQGRGFAVVADEVRALAGRSQESAQEINNIIETLQAGSRQAVVAMDSSLELVNSVSEQAKNAGDSLSIIVDAVDAIDGQTQQIATAVEQQSVVANEMSRSILNVNDISQENASAITQAIGVTKELANLADGLNQLTKDFRV